MMSHAELQTALDRLERTAVSEDDENILGSQFGLVLEAARAYLRLLPQNGQWDDGLVEAVRQVFVRTTWDLAGDDSYEVARAVLAALTEGATE